MTPEEVSDSLRENLPNLFTCTTTRRGAVRVRTPLLYPDGDLIDLFVLERDGEYLVTDYGDTLGWLSTQSVSDDLTVNQSRLIEDVCMTLGIEQNGGQMTLHVHNHRALADAVHRLGQAALRVADIQFTFRQHETKSISDEVDSWLKERSFNFRKRVRRSGKSGIHWTVDYEVAASVRTSLVFVISAGTRSAVRQRSEHVFASFVDLNDLRKGPSAVDFISLLDDSAVGSRDDIINLVSQVSRPIKWSERSELASLLTNSAMHMSY